MTTPIPSPPALPLIGNLLNVGKVERGEASLKPFERLADEYGPIYKLQLGGSERTVVANHRLFSELCDETRFFKVAGQALEDLNKLRDTGVSGLFTATSEKDADWAQAHRILMPAFGPLAIRDMFDEMHDIASQLVLKWARLGPGYRIPVVDDFTRLTLDTIALCAMDYRFNSFYQDEMHPFVQAMIGVLSEGASRLKTPKVVQKFMYKRNEQLRVDSKYQQEIAEKLVQQRKDNPSGKKDLLNAMIDGRDPKTGEGMRDELIAANMITFLIAGHETTSGLLSFAFYYMLKNPATYYRAQKEVDQVVAKGKITVDHLKHLHYIEAILRETLRLEPTAPVIVRGLRDDNHEPNPTLDNGTYALKKDAQVMCLLGKIQRDPTVYGQDANEFRPDRMLDEKFNKLPKNAWKPFGTGMRGCIGRPFAWQEALLVMAMLLQNFDFKLDDPAYSLQIKSNLTIKPDGFYMKSSLRAGIDASSLQERLSGSSGNKKSSLSAQEVTDSMHNLQINGSAKSKMTILYGSNTGTCQSFAQKLAADAYTRGFQATVKDMDSGTSSLPTNEPVVVITASYEGLPPDNATQFMAWLQSMDDPASLQGVQFAVFGCGHKDWTSTFQRVPMIVDYRLEGLGASRLVERGVSDASQGDMFSDFDTWEEQTFWPAITAKFGAGDRVKTPRKGLDMEISTSRRAEQLQQNVQHGKVLNTWVLTAPNEPEKRHLEIKLPDGMTYQAGDYLTVLPLNPDASVHRVLTHFSIPADSVITIKEGGPVTLPTNKPFSVSNLLKGLVELSQPATKKDIQRCLEFTSNNEVIEALTSLSGPQYQSEVLSKRISLLDILEVYSHVALPFAAYLETLPPMRSRHYSISSSPLRDPSICSITYGVIDATSMAGTSRFQGVSGTYLRSLRAGDAVQISIRSAPPAFHLPASTTTTPMMMFCNGTGLAPFHGFIQERATQLAANPGQRLAPALLFIGCRSQTADALYYPEFAQWAKVGAVDVRYAFSREPEHPEARGCKYVQDRMWNDKNDVLELWRAGAKVYLCGSPSMVEGVRGVARRLVEHQFGPVDQESVDEFFKGMKNERIAVDVFA